jgi:peptide methionine sulfoxide reductase msrA/msrB
MLITKAVAVLAIITFTLAGTIGMYSTTVNGFNEPNTNTEYKTAMTTEKSTDTTSRKVSQAGYDITPLSDAQIQELAEGLTEEEAKVILNKGTEAAFCGNLVDNKLDGTYTCRLCQLPLFKSDSKFTSGTGWPSFFQPVDDAHVTELKDTAYGMVRTEILCARCDGHLGHVFDDGPRPTGLRFCVNSVSLDFVEDGQPLPSGTVAKHVAKDVAAATTKTAYFGGGCFWGIEDRYSQLDGVLDSVSGYQGGDDTNPTYKEVCSGTSGHAESVMIKYDPSIISYGELLTFFFKIHNPTQGNRQGPDYGPQYRSMIFPTDDQQLKEAKAFIEAEQKEGKWSDRKITTEIMMAPQFYKAEEYHQDYHLKHGGHCAIPD